jgi:allene oxide cyclase-like protein
VRMRWLIVATVLLVAGLSASGVAFSSKAPISSTTTLRFKLQAVAGEQIDLGQAGESLGDEFVSSSNVLKQGSKVGRVESVCTITNTAPMTTLCMATLHLRSGQISLMGRVPGNALAGQSPIRVAVVGGTAAYRHSHGSATVQASATSTMTLVLTP